MEIVKRVKYGSVIYGKVIRLKPGSGSASNSLTIITIAKVDCRGRETGSEIKVLCWNSTKSKWNQLSDKARQLTIGSIITARVEFDIGDPNKAVAYELKKQGIYKVPTDNNDAEVVICGKIAKVSQSGRHLGIYVPLSQPDENGNFQTEWYLISFFDKAAEVQSKFLGKGDLVFVNGMKKEVELGGKKILQILPKFIKNISA